MKVGAIQSNYIPWRGYFDFIDDVDLFIFYDDVLYGQGKKWRNRNKIKTRHGLQWLSIPLKHGKENKLISEVSIDYSTNWQAKHLNLLFENYRKAPFFSLYIDQFSSLINKRYSNISELNVVLCKWINSLLEIQTEIKMSHDFGLKGDKKERVIALLDKVQATSYLTGPTALPYTDTQSFESRGIKLEVKTYEYNDYPQQWGTFVNNLSILDLIFNTGAESRKYMKSLTTNIVLVNGHENENTEKM